MKWLGLILAGPTLWAVTFIAVYALHGLACAGVTGSEGIDLTARIALIGLWAAGLLAFWPLSRIMPHGPELRAKLPRAWLWIGLVATGFTLFPVAVTTSC